VGFRKSVKNKNSPERRHFPAGSSNSKEHSKKRLDKGKDRQTRTGPVDRRVLKHMACSEQGKKKEVQIDQRPAKHGRKKWQKKNIKEASLIGGNGRICLVVKKHVRGSQKKVGKRRRKWKKSEPRGASTRGSRAGSGKEQGRLWEMGKL